MRVLIAIVLATGLASAGYAQDKMTQEGHAGQDFGDWLLKNKAPQTQYTPGGENNAGTVTINGDKVPINQIAPGYDPAKVAELQKLKDADETTLNNAAAQAQQQTQQDPDSAARAYRTIINNKPRTEQELSAQPMWQQTIDTLAPSHLDSLAKTYGACQQQTRYYVTNSTAKGMVHERSCEELHYPEPATIKMDVSAQPPQTLIILDQTRAVTADVDVPFDGTDGITGVFEGTYDVTWSGQVTNVAITDYPTSFNGFRGNVHITYNTTAGGSQSVTYKVNATLTALQVNVSANPPNPLMGSDAFCTAHWTCTDSAPRTLDGQPITSGMVPPLYPYATTNTPPSSQSPICWAASSTYDCPFNLGNICWTSVTGQQVCQDNTKDNTSTDTCRPLLIGQKCSVEHSECATGATGYGGFCYVTNYTMNCPTAVNVPNISSETSYPCAGAIRCMGNDCADDRKHEDQVGFADMQAQLNLVQHALSDTTTVQSSTVASADGTTRQTSRAAASTTTQKTYLFPGNAYECRKILGSTVDFCQEAGAAPNQTWFGLYTQNERQANARKALQLNQEQGPDPAGWKSLQSTSNWKLSTLKQSMTAKQETVNEDMPNGQSNTLQQADNGLGNQTQLTPVMDEYRKEEMGSMNTAQQWAGTKEELDLAVQRAAGACVNIGSYCKVDGLVACLEKRDVYCCFNSAMSKQIQVQMAGGDQAVANGAFGSPTHPQCGGIDATQFTGDVLQNMNYDDWEARSAEAGALPTLTNLKQRYSVDSLTGQGSSMVANTQTQRPNVIDRTRARLQTVDVQGAYNAMSDEAQASRPSSEQDPDVPGTITISPAYSYVTAGRYVTLQARRSGGKGAVSVNYATSDDTAKAGVDYDQATGTLSWADGEKGLKSFRVLTHVDPDADPAQPLRFLLALSNPVGGATLGGNTQGEVDINAAPVIVNNGGGSNGGPGTTPNPPQLDVSWQLNGPGYIQINGSGYYVENLNIDITNVGTGPASNIHLDFKTADPTATLWQVGSGPVLCGNDGTPMATPDIYTCVTSKALDPGKTTQISLSVLYNSPTINDTATCSISYQDNATPAGTYHVPPYMCKVSY